MPNKELLDPQGKTVAKNMSNVNITGVEDVRIGKFMEVTLEAESKSEAESKIETACKKILANVIMESFEFEVQALQPA